MLGVGASVTTNWWVTTINPGESEHRLKIKGGSEIHEQSKTGNKSSSKENWEGTLGIFERKRKLKQNKYGMENMQANVDGLLKLL